MMTVGMSKMNRSGEPVGLDTDSESDPLGVPSVKGKKGVSNNKRE